MSVSIILNGNEVSVPKNFFDVGIKASFEENAQANLTTEEFTFVLDAYTEIINWIAEGRNGGLGIFEGIPMTIVDSDYRHSDNVNAFQGIVDLQAGHTIQHNLKQVKARLRQDNGLNQLSDLLEPLDYGYLKSLGVITSADYVNVDYVVNKTDNGLETITTFVTIYLLSKQLADTVRAISETSAIIAGIASSSLSGAIGATVYAIAAGILQVAYAATLVILIIDFGKDLLNVLVQPLRTHKGIKLKTLLEKACEHIGYELQTSIDDLDSLVYLPSNLSVDEFKAKNVLKKAGSIEEGIPNVSDAGYTCTEMFQIARELFNGRFAILGGTVQFHSENSEYWLRQSGWVKPSAIQDQAAAAIRYNTDELKSSILIQFATDITDEYTIKNYLGTAYQVLTDAKTVGVAANKTIKGSDSVRIPWALGTRKAELNEFEKALKPLASLFDKLAGVFGKNPGLGKSIKSKVGVLQVSSNNHSTPKILYMSGGRMPTSHRNSFSAKTLWDKYHSEKSFVLNNYDRQRSYVENEVVPFNLKAFVDLLNNSYFRDATGKIGKVVNLEWNMSKDSAVISYWIQDTYTNNLIETYIEPGS